MIDRMMCLHTFYIFSILLLNTISESNAQRPPIQGCRITFNGIVTSNRTSDTVFYYLSCPTGTEFDSKPATVYKCNLQTGTVTPTPVPQCVLAPPKPYLDCGQLIILPCAPAEGLRVCGGYEKLPQTDQCEEGCYCPEGTVYHEEQCITEDTCPCTYNGNTYKAGESYEEECQSCICINGNWQCTPFAKTGCSTVCSCLGDPHYTTFDDTRYDYQGQCSYITLSSPNLIVETEHWPWNGQTIVPPSAATQGLATCVKKAIARRNSVTIDLDQQQIVKFNGAYITNFPTTIFGITIRKPSSDYLYVDFPDGAQIRWDGIYRLYIEVPYTYMNKTEGLCGTWNKNPNDDFTSRDGVVQTNVNDFGNSWKTDENCTNIAPDGIPNPCDRGDGSQKDRANLYCDIINSDVFKDCHNVVTQKSFYDNCIYDGCACEARKPASCMCPLISAYSTECSRNGVNINWTQSMPECETNCPDDQTFQTCGNSCTRSCRDISSQPNCTVTCVEGCNCPMGQTLNDHGECIPIDQCKCQRDRIDFPPGFSEIRGTDLCICENALWNCRPATPEEITEYPNIEDLNALCDKSLHWHFTSCLPDCSKTCENMNTYVETHKTNICQYGCKCDDGYVLRDKKCFPIEECPCELGGMSYKNGTVQQRDCNTCTCKDKKWNCTNRKCTSECAMWSGTHYKTFDGRIYDFIGECKYVLSKGTISREESFEIDVKTIACGELDSSCLESVTIIVSSGSAQVTIRLSEGKPIPNSQISKGILIKKVGLYVVVELINLSISVWWDGKRVYVKTDTKWRNKVSGLCGNYNGNRTDDFRTPTGQLTTLLNFTDSWRLNSNCPESIELPDSCLNQPDATLWALEKCEILNSDVFARCRVKVPVDVYYTDCIYDTCACDDSESCECLCNAIAAYAQECDNKGVPVRWRTQDFCPLQCDINSYYNPCVTTCLYGSCLTQPTTLKTCEKNTCVEGCSPKICTREDLNNNNNNNTLLLQCSKY